MAALNGTHLLLHRHYIMQIITTKEVKSGERQKGTDRWEMWFWATSICCINHITEGLEQQRARGPLAASVVFPLLSFLLQPPQHPLSSSRCPSLPSLVLSTSSLGYFLSGYSVWEMILISARPARALMQTTVSPHGGAAKLTGTNNFWHTAAWLLMDHQKETTSSRWAVHEDDNWVELWSDKDQRTRKWKNMNKVEKRATNGGSLADLTLPLSTHINSHLPRGEDRVICVTFLHFTSRLFSVKRHISLAFLLPQQSWSVKWLLFNKGDHL